MKSLVKKRVANVRLSQQQAVDLERAAKLESARRGEIIGESTLLRELAMPRVREILQGAALSTAWSSPVSAARIPAAAVAPESH